MSDDDNLSPWRKKFLASRMAIESILFERELLQHKKEKFSTTLLVLGGIWLFFSLLLAQWALRRGYFFGQADAASFGNVLHYAAYLKAQGFWALIKPEFTGLALNPPLYFLAYVPVLSYITSDLNLALIIVNSFFMFVLALAVFLAVRESRPRAAGWYSAAFVLALPFVMETARRPAPEMALMALVAALYACYIRSEELAHPKWTFAFAICMGLGFYAHSAFWLYAIPLVPFIVSGLANPFSRDEIFKGFFIGSILNLPWYIFALAAVAAGLVPVMGEYHGFWHYAKLGMAAAGLPMFILGALALAWLYFSVFMAYSQKKIVAAWFWVPYLVLAWGLRGSHIELLYPAMLSFAIAVAIMTPHPVRKFILIFVLVLGAVNQSGYVRPMTAGGYPVAGLPLPPASDYRAKEIMDLVKANAPAQGGLAGVYGDADFNSASLRYADSGPAPVRFQDVPACPACPFIIIHKTPSFGWTESSAEKDFAELKSSGWFASRFERRAELELPDMSKTEVYVKVPSAAKFLPEGTHAIHGLKLGPLRISDASLTLSGFNESSGVYEKAVLFAPVAELRGGDVYGLTLDISGLSLAGPSLSPLVPSGVSSVKVRSARISSYAVERFLSARFPILKDLEVKLDKTVQVSGQANGRVLDAEFSLTVKDGGVLEVKPLSFSLGPVSVPPFLLQLFSYRQDFTDNPYGITFSGLRVKGQLIQLY